ncbi:hypothetical protein SAMN00777080_3092 [Aquiflexum balticum DSM 16537]|uniref:Uncharacterized protein n=1 Tax=Aquiflexum balticum DSM 16537 TaxID=758820 RepID=A0A1W2H695_9BACT|nr:hypothetical protein SAMN00777080_3092 [Aquiflexum balticum DSM 16537]
MKLISSMVEFYKKKSFNFYYNRNLINSGIKYLILPIDMHTVVCSPITDQPKLK